MTNPDSVEDDVTDEQPDENRGTERTGGQGTGRWPPNWVTPRATSVAGMPRWVKVFGLIAGLFVVLVVVMLLTGHGPGRHLHHAQGLRVGNVTTVAGHAR